MTDPLKPKAVNTVIVNEMAMKFSKVHSPKMKSIYWKHFGFPTNESDHIITKQSVVCVLCHKVLTNHGNTTNLRAHLQHRHKDVFIRLCRDNGIRVPPKRAPKHIKQEMRSPKSSALGRKIKLEYDSNNDFHEDSVNNDDHSMLYESMVPITYEDDGESYAKVEATLASSNFAQASKSIPTDALDSIDMVDEESEQNEAKCSSYRLDVIEMDSYQLQEALVNLVSKDLRNVSTLYEEGMSQFLHTINGGSLIPTKKKIEAMIQEMHSDKLTTLSDQIKVHSQVKSYSLGFELWTNVESKFFLSIFYNYTTDVPEFILYNQLYCTVEYNKFTNIDIIFEEFNLENCTAAIVNYDEDDYLKGFLKSKKIPAILAYSAIVDKCLQSVFALPSVIAVIEDVKEVVTRYASEIHSKDVEIPSINVEFPWTYYELLKFFSETVSWPEDVDTLVSSAKTVIETLAPLAVTLDTLKGEDIPQSSMVTPISTKILNKQINITETDDDFVSNIKSTTSINLQKFVLSDDHLTISALLDPRFHRLIDVGNINNCVDILSEKHKKMSEWQGYCTKKEKPVAEPSPAATSRKSNLELFFDIQDCEASTSTRNDTTIENDIKRYRNEVYVSLDESPFVWWLKVGHLYGTLKQLAVAYQCVPCVVNMNFKKTVKQQICEHLKRYMLTGNLIDSILFLHHHTK